MDSRQRFLLDSEAEEATTVRQQLSLISFIGVVIFAGVVSANLLGENYTNFFDEDVSFFERDIEDDEHWIYGVIMFLSFFISFVHTVYEGYKEEFTAKLEIAKANGSYERVFDTLYPGRKNGTFYNTWWFSQFQNITWETIYGVLWIYIALTDLFGILFVLLGRYTAVYTLLRPWKKKELIQISRGTGRLLY